MGNDMPERVYAASCATCGSLGVRESGQLTNNLASNHRLAYTPIHDVRVVALHREDTCTERMKKLRETVEELNASIVAQSNEQDRRGNHQSAQYLAAYSGGIREVLTLLDSLTPKKENDHA